MEKLIANNHNTDTLDWKDHLYIIVVPNDGDERLRTEQSQREDKRAIVSVFELINDGYLDDNIAAFTGKRVIVVDILTDDIMKDIAKDLETKAQSVTIVSMPDLEDGNITAWLNQPGNSVENFFDICSALSAQHLSPITAVTPATDTTVGMGTQCEADGYHLRTMAGSEGIPTELKGNTIRVQADFREDNGNWFRFLVFNDREGNAREALVPMNWFITGHTKIRNLLLDYGFLFPSDKKEQKSLLDSLYETKPKSPTGSIVKSIGWHGSSFVLPDRVIGPDSDRILFNGSACEVTQKGTLDQWVEQNGKYCIGNSRLLLAVSLAFAGPLLQLLGMENGGVNFKGNNGKGKSTLLFVATSVISGRSYCRSWRATVNGLERLGVEHNNLTLIMDELGQLAPKEAGDAIYQLGNGMEKTRRGGNNSRRLPHFSLNFLSSGEISLEELIRSAGNKVMGGQTDRLVEIPAEPDDGFGVYENLHGFESGEALSDHLRLQTSLSYGTPLIAHLERLTQELEESREFVTSKMNEFHQTFVPEGEKAHIARVARRFAIIASAGELATHFGITGWPEGEAMRGAGVCFRAWLSTIEGRSHLYRDKLFDFLAVHDTDRFCPVGGNPADIKNCAGFRRPTKDGGTEFYIYPEIFKGEIFNGFINRRVCDELASQGLLIRNNDGHNTRVWSPSGSDKASRWFHVVIGESDKLRKR